MYYNTLHIRNIQKIVSLHSKLLGFVVMDCHFHWLGQALTYYRTYTLRILNAYSNSPYLKIEEYYSLTFLPKLDCFVNIGNFSVTVKWFSFQNILNKRIYSYCRHNVCL